MGWLIVVLLFWKPIYIVALTVYHFAHRDTVSFTDTLNKLKTWGTNLWSLVNPSV